MKRIIKNNYKIIIAFILGLIFSLTTVYAIEAYIESSKVSFDNKHTKTNNVQDAIDELYERSGIHKEKWVDKELNGADPVLQDPLIPVEINDDGEAYYANLNSEWYNYSKKKWANAVILVDNPSNKNYGVGDHIIKDDIEGYFVWIPRYQYKIWDLGQYENYIDFSELKNTQVEDNTSVYSMFGKERIIDIKFGSADKLPKMNESEAKINNYYTHPAFTLGDKDLNGIWVGKFEVGYKGATSTAQAEVDSIEPGKVIIKPNVYSWRNIKVKNMFMTSYNYKRNLDSHMLKNTEWGAIAYLSHSKYGIGAELNVNNVAFETGYSATPNSDQTNNPGKGAARTEETKTQKWNTTVGYLASTTGNISGIYDIRGGTLETVAACVEGSVGSSSFSPEELANYMVGGYIDKYGKSDNMYLYKNRILGDATGEMGPFYRYYDADGGNRPHSWYADHSHFISNNSPWFVRGGSNMDGRKSGLFYFGTHGGGTISYVAFRLALSPQ